MTRSCPSYQVYCEQQLVSSKDKCNVNEFVLRRYSWAGTHDEVHFNVRRTNSTQMSSLHLDVDLSKDKMTDVKFSEGNTAVRNR